MTATPPILQTRSQTPRPKGIIDTIKTRVWAWRYRRQLQGLVEQRHHTVVYAQVAGSDFVQQMDSLTAGMLPDFSPETRTLVSDRSKALEANIQEVSGSTVQELRDEIAIKNTAIQRLQSDLSDKQQILHLLEESSVEPPPQDIVSLRRISELQKALDYGYASFARLRTLAVLTVGQIIAVLGLEGILIYLSLLPLFVGVSGVTQWMVAAQAILITVALVYLGHNLWSESRDTRWFSMAALVAMITTLALVRAAGMMTYGGGTAPPDSADYTTTTWALISMMALAGLVLALIGGQAFYRLTTIFNDASRLRNATAEDIAKKEAELNAHTTHHAHQQIYRLRQKRLIPSTQEDIQRITATLQSEVATTRRIIARRVKRAVRSRLSSDISNMARQLAEWRHQPLPTTQKRASMQPVTTTATLLCIALLGQAACTISSGSVAAHHVLVDNSGSIISEVVHETKLRVFRAARDWVKTAKIGDEFTVWWLTEVGDPYPANHRTLTMPALSIPAYAARERFLSEALATLEKVFNNLPQGVTQTPLLEAIYYIGLTQDDEWRLLIVSDLQQDTPTWNAHTANVDDDELLDAMKVICPFVKIPPVAVSLVTWPGIMARGQNTIKEHQRHRKRFEMFFRQWAPEAILRITSL